MEIWINKKDYRVSVGEQYALLRAHPSRYPHLAFRLTWRLCELYGTEDTQGFLTVDAHMSSATLLPWAKAKSLCPFENAFQGF